MLPGVVDGAASTATRESLGTTSFISSSCFPPISGARVANPVMFPPGRARLTTNLLATGSLSCAMTIGIVLVASWAPQHEDCFSKPLVCGSECSLDILGTFYVPVLGSEGTHISEFAVKSQLPAI